jgi:hypothetical protein
MDTVAPDARAKLLDYFKKAYKNYHGGADGADRILAPRSPRFLRPI